MPQFFIILLKINLVLVLFGAAYYLVLRRLTFYTLNRVFLVFGILFATLYPFIDLTDFFHQNTQAIAFVPNINQKVTALVPSKFISLNWQLLTILFYVGVLLMAIRLIVQFVSLYKMHRKSSPGSVANYQVRILNEPVSPFSFWQTVYINPALHKESELKTILAHESIHVKQWHSLDIILAELSVVFYWFNPGVWLMKKAVKENLEFITDQKILNKGVDKKAYQYSLLDVGNLTPAVEIVNNFNLSDLKKRIKMMNTKRSSKLTLSRYLLVLPVLLSTTLAFTVSKKEIKKHFAPIKQVLINNNFITANDVQTVKVNKHIRKVKKDKITTVDIKIDTAKRLTLLFNAIYMNSDSAKGGVAKPKTEVLNIKLASEPDEALLQSLKGTVHKILIIKTDSAQLVSGNAKRFQGFKIEPEQQTEVIGKQKQEEVIIRGFKRTSSDSIQTANPTFFFLNGKQITEAELSKVNPEAIQTVKVVKGQSLKDVQIKAMPKN